MTRRHVAAALGAVLAALVAGCGLGPGRGAEGVTLTVTRDFGGATLGRAGVERVAGHETVMRFVQRRFRVRTRYGGGFVQSIDGLAGGVEHGRPLDWFYYVNGIEARRGAATTVLHAGDRIWWDRHDWGAAMSIPAVVGSFPEPFRSGSAGKRLPVVVSCSVGAGMACAETTRRLAAAGVPAGRSAPGATAGRSTLRILVGPWAAIRGDPAARRLEAGPAVSGVFARPSADGRAVALLDRRGRPVRRLGAGAGLVAATRAADEQPTWVLTGTDAAGTLAAARGLDGRHLADRFALALSEGSDLPLPLAADPSGRG